MKIKEQLVRNTQTGEQQVVKTVRLHCVPDGPNERLTISLDDTVLFHGPLSRELFAQFLGEAFLSPATMDCTFELDAENHIIKATGVVANGVLYPLP